MAAGPAEGDALVVKGTDRFGRNYEEILEARRGIARARDVEMAAFDMQPFDTMGPAHLDRPHLAELYRCDSTPTQR